MHGLFGHPEETWTGVRHKAPSAASAYSAVSTAPRPGIIDKSVWYWKKGIDRLRPAPSSENVKNMNSNFEVSSDPIVTSYDPPDTVFWPKKLLPEALPEARRYTWGYDVDINHVFSNASQATNFQHAATLLSDLANERVSVEDVSIIFTAYTCLLSSYYRVY